MVILTKLTIKALFTILFKNKTIYIIKNYDTNETEAYFNENIVSDRIRFLTQAGYLFSIETEEIYEKKGFT